MIVSYSNVADFPRGAERAAWGEAGVLGSESSVTFVSSSRPDSAPFEQRTVGGWTRRLYHPFGRRNPLSVALFHLLSMFNPIVFVESLRLFRQLRPRVVHTNNLLALSPSVWLAARLSGSVVVHTHQDLWLACERATLTDKHGLPCRERQLTCLLCRSLRPVKRAQLALVTREVFSSDWARQRLGRRGDVVPSFATGSLAPPRSAPVTDGPVVFVGALTANKGVSVLIEAFRRSSSMLPSSANLVIAGSGPLETAVQSAAETDERIEFVGELEPPERDALLRRASLLVIPSTCAENSPLVFFEALAAGLPVLVSEVGGMPELRRYGNVESVPPNEPEALAEALVALLTDLPRLRELGLAARRSREEALPERFGRQLAAVFAETASQSTRMRSNT